MNKLQALLDERSIKAIGRWADPPGHVNYAVLDAPDAHAVQQAIMESGLGAHTSTEIRPVLDMG